MKISQIFNLGKTQRELDFVDIDPETDTGVFVDPFYLSLRNDRWSLSTLQTIRSFFQKLITMIANGNVDEARELFLYLQEPNETCLGLSTGKPQGRGVGPENSEDIFQSLLNSGAAQTGLLEDIEDCHIFVDNFGPDKLSDMATNIIRRHLIDYTVAQCELYNIPLSQNIQSGFFWNRTTETWENRHEKMLVIDDRKILLVPKGIVSYKNRYTPKQYHQHYVLEFLANEQLQLQTALVKKRYRKGVLVSEYVTKKSVKERISPGDKLDLRQFTQRHPTVFQRFKADLRQTNIGFQSGLEIIEDDFELGRIVEHLISQLDGIAPGNEEAGRYHLAVLSILHLLFHPNLICPTKEREIHDGRKRIDIVFDNAAATGVFSELNSNHETPCPYVMIECKNYSRDINNPELDQIGGRFSPQRGKVGVIICRAVADFENLLNRCRDTYRDHRGLIIPLVDEDLKTALRGALEGNLSIEDRIRELKREIQLT